MASIQKKIDKMFNHDDGCLASLGAMKPEEYYQYAYSKIQGFDLKNKALKKLGIEESEVSEVEPLSVWGFPEDRKSRWSYVYNGIALSPEVQGTWMFFSDSRVYVYSFTYNTITEAKKETADEFSYKDIVNISTYEASVEKKYKKKTETYTYSQLALAVPGDKMYFGCMNDAEMERKLKTIKQKLREKKE